MPHPVKQFVWLDWLRFAAALIVMLGHARGFAFVEYGALPAGDKGLVTMAAYGFTRLGHEAVIVFFVLSGFLVGGKAIERARSGAFIWTDYAIDRLSRVATPLIPAVLLTAIVAVASGGTANPLHVIGNLLGVQGVLVPMLPENAPLWSLAYEIWFYILAGAVAVMALGRGTATAALIVVASLAVFTVLEATYLFCWLVGALAYLRLPGRVSRRQMAAGIAMAIVGVALSQASSSSKSVALGPVVNAESALFLLSVGVALVVRNLCAVRFDGGAVGRSGTWLASFSYTLYLTHFPILWMIRAAGLERQAAITPYTLSVHGALVAVCMVAAYVLYWVFERRTAVVRVWLKGAREHQVILS